MPKPSSQKTTTRSTGRTPAPKATPQATSKAPRRAGPPLPAPLAPRFHRYALPRGDDGVRYWLAKTEPEVFGWNDLVRAPGGTTHWDGVRNYQVRNFMRDHMRVGDLVIVYHSNAEPPCAVGIARVVRDAYPDHTAFDAAHPHFDAASDPANPTWLMVDLCAERALTPVSLATMKSNDALRQMELVQPGSRLSITPLTAEEFATVVALGGGAGERPRDGAGC